MGRFSEALTEQDTSVTDDAAAVAPSEPGRFSQSLSSPATESPEQQAPISLEAALVSPPQQDQIQLAEEGKAKSFGQGLLKTGQGFAQMFVESGVNLGLMDEETLQMFNESTEKQRSDFVEAFREEYGDNVSFDIADMMGQISPAFAIKGGAKTGTGRAVKGGLIGGLFGGAQFRPTDSEDTLLKNVVIGSGLGIATATVLNMFTFARDWFRSSTGKLLRATATNKEGQTVSVIKNEAGDWVSAVNGKKVPLDQFSISDDFAQSQLELSKRTGVPVKLSQATDDPAAAELEKIARNTSKGERLARTLENKQLEATMKLWGRMRAKIIHGSKTFGKDMEVAIDRTLNHKKDGLFAIRANNAKRNFQEVADLTDGRKVLRTDNFNAQLDKLTEDALRRPASPQMIKELAAIREEFKNGVVDALEMQKLLQKYGKASKGTGRIFSDKIDRADDLGPAKSLFKAINDDLDAMAALNNEQGRSLRVARDAYQQDTAAINAVRDSALGKLLNKRILDPDGNPIGVTAETIEAQINRMRPEEIKATMSLVSQFDPLIKKKLQRFWIERFMEKAVVRGEKGGFPLNPNKLVEMKDNANFNVIFSGDPATRAMVQDGIDIARVISAHNQRQGGRFFQQLKEASGVAASMDRTFVARLTTELFTPNAIAKYVTDEKGIRALQEFAKPFNQNAWAAALVQLKNIATEDDIEPEQ